MKFTLACVSKVCTFVCLIIRLSLASYPFFGNCPQHPVIANFSMTRYLGDWYEIEKYFSFSDVGNRCTSHKYTNSDNNTIIYFRKYLSGGERISVPGKLVFAGKHRNGILETFSKSLKKNHRREQRMETNSYWVLDTDYTNYSVVWFCTNHGIMNFQNIVFLSRTRNPSNYIRGLAYGVVSSHGLSPKLLFETDHEECPNLFRRKINHHTKDKESSKRRSFFTWFGY